MTDAEPTDQENLNWLLDDLARRVPHTRGVVLLSMDGLPRAIHGMDAQQAEPLAAAASGLFSIAGAAGTNLGLGRAVRQVLVELGEALVFIAAAGSGSALAVVADHTADANVIGYEMGQLVDRVQPFLATPTRRQAVAQHGAPG